MQALIKGGRRSGTRPKAEAVAEADWYPVAPGNSSRSNSSCRRRLLVYGVNETGLDLSPARSEKGPSVPCSGAVFGCLVCPPERAAMGRTNDEAVTVQQVAHLQRLTRSKPGQCRRNKGLVQRREPCPVAAAAVCPRPATRELSQTAFDPVPAVWNESGTCMELETLAPTPRPAPAPAWPAMPRATADLPACAPDFFAGSVHAAQPLGHLELLFDVETYVTRGTATSNSTIIFLTDDFGLNLVNNRLLADQYASKTGLRVLVPNLLPGGGLPLSTIGLSEKLAASVQWYNLLGHARRTWAALKITIILTSFSFKVRRTFPSVLNYVRAVRASLPLGSKLGIAGFCLGGHWSSRLCAEHATERGGSYLVGAHFTAHPSNVDPREFARLAGRFRVPQSLALGDRDAGLPIDQAHELETNLRWVYRDNLARLDIRIYDGCGRGFALRADPQTDDNEAADMALEQAVAWFRRWLV